MNKFLAISIFALSITGAVSVADPIQNYQNTPPFNPGGLATTVSSTDQMNLCTGNCVKNTDLKYTSADRVRHYIYSASGDSIFTFLDTAMGFNPPQADTIKVKKFGFGVCWHTTAGFAGTSDSANFKLNPFPALIRPPTTTLIVAMGGAVTDSGVANRTSDFQIASTGVVTIRRTNIGTPGLSGVMQSVFLASGSKALAAGAGGCYDIQP